MVNITHKNYSLRKAVAQAVLKVSQQATIEAIVNKQVPKGDVLEMAKTAGLFAAKRTHDMIPDCHPLPVEFTAVRYEIAELSVRIEVEVHTIYRTGVEVEAMHAASVVALTMYDMLKPIDKGISIEQIKLVSKKGGKSDYAQLVDKYQVDAWVMVCSSAVLSGKKPDDAGQEVLKKLDKLQVPVRSYQTIPDDFGAIQAAVNQACQAGVKLLLLTGGTGIGSQDLTTEAVKPLIERAVPGIEEAIRSYGQQRTPYSMLSRSVSGLIGDTLVLALPGSTAGARESMDAVFPAVLHIFRVLEALKPN